MGVERFFSSIKKDFDIIENMTYPYKKISTKYFLLDFNSIVHVVSQYILNEMNLNKNLQDIEELNEIIIKSTVDFVIVFLKEILILKDLEYFGIYIDGVPTMAKIMEQKKRRYMYDILNNLVKQKKISWSKNNISPATYFMKKLEEEFASEKFKNKIKLICPNLKKYILSTTNEPGEGEMKILNYIRTLNMKDKILVYSPDSDMIILLMLVNNNINLIRYDQQNSKDIKKGKIFNLINMNIFKNILFEYCMNKTASQLDKERVINDIIFLFTIFGDDFIPRLESFRIDSDLFILIDYYLINIIDNDYLLLNKDVIEINTDSFLNYLNLLKNIEISFLHRNYFLNKYSNFKSYNDSMIHAELKSKPMNNILKNDLYYFNILKHIDYDSLFSFMKSRENLSKYKKLYYYKISREKLADHLTLYKKKFNTYPLNFKINKIQEKLMIISYSSKHYPHVKNLSYLDQSEKETYKIERKLDEYFNFTNPIDKFYQKNFSDKSRINKNELNKYYEIHFSKENIKDVVDIYLQGWNWILNYYFNNIVDNLWYYKFSRSPLLHQIVDNYNKNILLEKNNNFFYISQLEQFIYISPFKLSSDINKQLHYLNSFFKKDDIKKIVSFLIKNKNYFYDLDKYYKKLIKNNDLLDCSISLFISKCHLKLLDKSVDIKSFCLEFRKYLPIKQQNKYY